MLLLYSGILLQVGGKPDLSSGSRRIVCRSACYRAVRGRPGAGPHGSATRRRSGRRGRESVRLWRQLVAPTVPAVRPAANHRSRPAAPQAGPDRGDFTPDAAAVDTRWCGDITYVSAEQGWLFLAAVIDVASRRVVGWATADHLRTGQWPRPCGRPAPDVGRTGRRSSTPIATVTSSAAYAQLADRA
ncbi:DDE-type integrase/transposase/recombinase [Nonomuraea fuscirosea]|uniref:DDE-type integrase/transposase/recombinase n=1 Tax=Nonomuraea fuscirosea TaxID=1291556 RepID=UPI003F4D6BAB